MSLAKHVYRYTARELTNQMMTRAPQVMGRKMFVCFSPKDTQYLYKMESEVETAQSPIDVLHVDRERVQFTPSVRHYFAI